MIHFRIRVSSGPFLFPLDCGGGFGGDVVDDAVDAFDLVDDAVRGARQEVGGETGPVGGHAVARGDGAEGEDVFVGTLVAHDTDRLHR